MNRIAIMASGGGSNARKIVEYFENHASIEVGLLMTNKKNVGALAICDDYDIPSFTFDRTYFYDTTCILKVLEYEQINFIVLAGFLWRIPPYLIDAYPDKIINIHPSLLPKFGGAGMYGIHVHRAVREANEIVSGMTIHLVNEAYDDGNILYQDSCPIEPQDSPEDIAAKVLILEHKNFGPVIEKWILGLL